MSPPLTMLDSAAYRRMRAENPSEFVPRSVFFTHERDSEIDRGNSFWVKAALVYEAVTGRHVNDSAKPVATGLLLYLAEKCRSRIHNPPPLQQKTVADALAAPLLGKEMGLAPQPTASTDQGVHEKTQSTIGGEKTTELPDEGTDENKRLIDAIFLVAGFLPRLITKAKVGDVRSISRDAVDESFKSTHMQDIVTDVIKLENQLPLKHLLDVVDHVENAVRAAAGSPDFEGLQDRLKAYELGFTRGTFHNVISAFCGYYSPFFSKQAAAAAATQERKIKNAVEDAKMESRTLLEFLHASVVPRAPEGKGAGGGGRTSRMPAARELSRSGVRFGPGEDGRAAVEFDEPAARLRLPALVFDFKLATVARNLLAREYEERSKPVTRYFQMMNELVEDVADVRVLLRAGVVRAGSSGAHEVHDLIKTIDGLATYPSVFMAMDVQIAKVKQFHDKRMQNFFVRYRPGVILASSLAAVSVVAIVAARRNRA